jgi:hypothetical protein
MYVEQQFPKTIQAPFGSGIIRPCRPDGAKDSLGLGNYKHVAPDGASPRPSQYVKEQWVSPGTYAVGPPREDFSMDGEKSLVHHYPYFNLRFAIYDLREK